MSDDDYDDNHNDETNYGVDYIDNSDRYVDEEQL